MKDKINLKKITGFIGALLFIMSMMISHGPSNVIASGGEEVNSTCNGSGIPCASHLPDKLPKTGPDQ